VCICPGFCSRNKLTSYVTSLLLKIFASSYESSKAYVIFFCLPGCSEDVMTSDHSPVFANFQVGVRGQYVSNAGIGLSSWCSGSRHHEVHVCLGLLRFARTNWTILCEGRVVMWIFLSYVDFDLGKHWRVDWRNTVVEQAVQIFWRCYSNIEVTIFMYPHLQRILKEIDFNYVIVNGKT